MIIYYIFNHPLINYYISNHPVIIYWILPATYFQYFAASICSTHPVPSTTQIVSALMECILGIFRKYRICAQLLQILLHSSLFTIFIWYTNFWWPFHYSQSFVSKTRKCYELCVYKTCYNYTLATVKTIIVEESSGKFLSKWTDKLSQKLFIVCLSLSPRNLIVVRLKFYILQLKYHEGTAIPNRLSKCHLIFNESP